MTYIIFSRVYQELWESLITTKDVNFRKQLKTTCDRHGQMIIAWSGAHGVNKFLMRPNSQLVHVLQFPAVSGGKHRCLAFSLQT